MKKDVIAVAISGLWITTSEFIRNEFLLKSYWVDHYTKLGMEFETLPLNGILWLTWSFVLSFIIFRLLKHLSFKETITLAWLFAFVLMWITIFNLQVLPIALLLFAVPLSIIEVIIATLIINKISIQKKL